MSKSDIAKQFLDACETPQWWEGSKIFVATSAGFCAQGEPLADMTSIEEYSDSTKAFRRLPLQARPIPCAPLPGLREQARRPSQRRITRRTSARVIQCPRPVAPIIRAMFMSFKQGRTIWCPVLLKLGMLLGRRRSLAGHE